MPVVLRSKTCSRYMPTLSLPLRSVGHHQRKRDERPAVLRPRLEHRQLASRSTSSPRSTTCWHGAFLTSLAPAVARSFRLIRTSELVLHRRRHVERQQVHQPLRDRVEVLPRAGLGIDAERPRHAVVAAHQVDGDRHRVALARLAVHGVLEEQRRPDPLAHSVGDLADLEDRVDLGGDPLQLPLLLEQRDELAQVLDGHALSSVGRRRAALFSGGDEQGRCSDPLVPPHEDDTARPERPPFATGADAPRARPPGRRASPDAARRRRRAACRAGR